MTWCGEGSWWYTVVRSVRALRTCSGSGLSNQLQGGAPYLAGDESLELISDFHKRRALPILLGREIMTSSNRDISNASVAAISSNANAARPDTKPGNDRRYKRGYDTSHLSLSVQLKLKAAEACNPIANIVEALLTLGSIPAIAVLAIYLTSRLDGAFEKLGWEVACAGLIYVVAVVLIARQMRGLELMVHDVSHQSWFRSNPKLNNILGDALVAFPVLSSVRTYWRSHCIHHGHFGSTADPCRQRFANMGLVGLDLSSKWKIAKAVLKWLPAYNAAYYKEIGSQSARQWACFFIWHLTVLMAPTATLFALTFNYGAVHAVGLAAVTWVTFWMLPATSVLPVIRSIAESEEHDYDAGVTEFETTYTNDSWLHRLLIHPKNDAYHLIHHMFPNIPERRHHSIHKLLMAHDSRYQFALRRRRLLNC
jgi:fatty acid desaturase